MSKKMYTQSHSIARMINKLDRKEVILEPRYQRNQVWDLELQGDLIEVILKDYHIPNLFFRINNEVCEVVDGQQRLSTIILYKGDKFKSNDGYLFSELDEKRKNIFNDFNLNITFMEGLTDEETSYYFLKLNNQVPLISSEKRNGSFGIMRDFIKFTVEKHPVFEKYKPDNNRFTRDDSLAQAIKLISKGGSATIQSNNLEVMYMQNKEEMNDDLKKETILFLNTIDKLMIKNHTYIKCEFIIMYFVYKYIKDNNLFNENEVYNTIKEWYFDKGHNFIKKENNLNLDKYTTKKFVDNLKRLVYKELERIIFANV